MGAGFILVDIVFAVFVLVAIPGPIIWAIRKDHREHRAALPAVEMPSPVPVLAEEASVFVEEPAAGEQVTVALA